MKSLKPLKSRTLSNTVTVLFIIGLFFVAVVSFILALIDEGVSGAGYLAGIFALTILGIATALAIAWQQMTAFLKIVHGMAEEDASEVLRELIFGLPTIAPKGPSITVSEGRVDPDGPERLRKVGGPGFVSIRPDSAIITERGGYLYRVLGPGFHELERFERIWDVVDLRRQHRRTTVEAVTRDGILVTTEVEVFFRVAGGNQFADQLKHYPFTEDVILRLTTMKRVMDEKGSLKRWPELVMGNVSGTVRNKLEAMHLDEILSLQDENGEDRGRGAATEAVKRQPPLTMLSQELEAAVRQSVGAWGIEVEAVRIGPIQPADPIISRQWVEHWRANWERAIRRWNAQIQGRNREKIEEAHIRAEVDLLLQTLQSWEALLRSTDQQEGRAVLAQMIQMRFMEVLRSMAQEDPLVQMTVLKQARSLQDMLVLPDAGTEAPDGLPGIEDEP